MMVKECLPPHLLVMAVEKDPQALAEVLPHAQICIACAGVLSDHQARVLEELRRIEEKIVTGKCLVFEEMEYIDSPIEPAARPLRYFEVHRSHCEPCEKGWQGYLKSKAYEQEAGYDEVFKEGS